MSTALNELSQDPVAHSILRMTNYFSNAFFHKRISNPFIASERGTVRKIGATVKCEDAHEAEDTRTER
jgi:hypothetical protein